MLNYKETLKIIQLTSVLAMEINIFDIKWCKALTYIEN